MALELKEVKVELQKIIDELIASIQVAIGKIRNIARVSPRLMLNDFPRDFPGEARKISELIGAGLEELSEEIDKMKRSKVIHKDVLATFQSQVFELRRLQHFYRYIGKTKQLPGGVWHRIMSKYSDQKIIDPFEKIRLILYTGVMG